MAYWQLRDAKHRLVQWWAHSKHRNYERKQMKGRKMLYLGCDMVLGVFSQKSVISTK